MTRTFHYHACTCCRDRYGCNCADRTVNDRCNPCRSGIASTYAANLRPRECCHAGCRRATKDELKTYRLAGPGPWFVCPTCKRQHSFDPKELS